ncbi:MAG: hypothetical protein SGPRY_010820, partial [Prymnesium sp.]
MLPPPEGPPLPSPPSLLASRVSHALKSLSPILSLHAQLSHASALLSDALSDSSVPACKELSFQPAPWALRGKFCAFLSHFKAEAATEARLVQIELEKMMGQPDLRQLKAHVLESDVLVLLLTTNYLTRPWCLIEILTAIEHRLPIVALSVRGGHPYDYGEAHRFLERLEETLPPSNPGAIELLEQYGFEATTAAFTLSSVLPGVTALTPTPSPTQDKSTSMSIIATEMSVAASKAVLRAQLFDLTESMRSASPLEVPGEQAMWEQRRAIKYGYETNGGAGRLTQGGDGSK